MNDRRADPLVMLVGDDEMKRVWGGSKDCWSRKLSDGSRVDRMFTGSIAHIWEGRHCRYAFRDNLASARLSAERPMLIRAVRNALHGARIELDHRIITLQGKSGPS